MRNKIFAYHYIKLLITSLLIGFICSIIAESLKHLTEHFEERIFEWIKPNYPILLFILPSVGITIIYFLRKYAFKNRKNKGITEIYKTLDQRKDHLPFFKIPSHYINGFLTVIFGGSTGIEVSTVVATATVGNVAYKKEMGAYAFKREMICAGVTAGVAVLFASPIAGWLFAMEVIARKINKSLIISCTASAIAAALFIYFFDGHTLLPFSIENWKWSAFPFFFLLSLMGGALAVFFTLTVIKVKDGFAKINNNFIRVNLGAIAVGTLIYFLPFLFGDSYHGLKDILAQSLETKMSDSFMFTLLLLVSLKPIVSSLTLGAGGDGGVFAPSIVAGAVLGVLFAGLCNKFLGTHLLVLNFALVGAAATLSAAIHAPLTALFLVCNLVPNGFSLFIPLLLAAFVAKTFAAFLLPYNVYTYKLVPEKDMK